MLCYLQKLTPSGPDRQVGVYTSHDWIVSRYEKQRRLTRPQDLHAIVEHTATKSNNDKDVVSAQKVSLRSLFILQEKRPTLAIA